MTPDRFRIDMIMTEIFLSKWLNSPIEMTATSYWYEGKERRFFTLCYLSIRQSFFLSLGQENLKVIYCKKKDIFIGKMTVHFGHRKYSQWDSKSAPKNSQSFIISIGQTICKENIIEVDLERIIPQ